MIKTTFGFEVVIRMNSLFFQSIALEGLTFKLCAAREAKQSKQICGMKHHAAREHNLILHQFHQQDQPQFDNATI
jgi:hypothetical protein